MDLSKFSNEEIEGAMNKALTAKDFANALMFERELNNRQKTSTPSGEKTDIVEQSLSGIYEGLASGFGAPVDITTSGLQKIGVPIGEKPVGGSESLRDLFQALSADQAISDVKPQTRSQRIVRGGTEAIGETIPAAATIALAGPKAALQAAPSIYQGAKNALASVRTEAAKAPTAFAATEAATSFSGGAAGAGIEELFPDNPTAEMIAEILGAVGGGKIAQTADKILTKAPKGPLSAVDLKKQAGKLYELQKAEGLSAQPAVTDKIYNDVFRLLDQQGYLTPVRGSNKVRVAPDYTKLRMVVSILEGFAEKGMTAASIQTTRRAISGRMNDAKGEEKNALRNVLRTFDANTSELAPEIQVANALYSRAMKADQIEELLSLAKSRATSNNLDLENAVRTEFRPLYRRIIQGKEAGWTQTEKDQIAQIVEGGSAENIARFIGKFAPTGSVSAIASIAPAGVAGMLTRDPLTALGVAGTVAGVGATGRVVGSQLQKRNIDNLYQSIIQSRNMSPAAQQRMRAALTAYLSGQAATQ